VLFKRLGFLGLFVDLEFADELVCAGGEQELAVGRVGQPCFAGDVRV
jgi:hypothetical protein